MVPIQDERADELKAEAISVRRARRAAWQNAHVDRINREREARETAKEYRQIQREAESGLEGTKQCSGCQKALPLNSFHFHKNGRRQPSCKSCRSAAARESYYKKLGRAVPTGDRRRHVSPERQRKAVERIAHLTSLLMGTNPGNRIASEEGWDVATSELQSLWLQSGDKECVSCKAVVPPSAMLPPGPANFYPGKCRSCALAEYRESRLRVFGKVADGPRPILLRDGSTITVAELARRCRERVRL